MKNPLRGMKMSEPVNQALRIVYLARHGETAWTLSGQHTGLTDLPLTERGERNARRLQERLRALSFAKVFTSPLQRAKRTCELAGFGTVAEVDQDLVEWNYGEYEGRRTAEIRDGNAAVTKLRTEEQRLADLVKRLSEAMAGFPVDTDEPFAKSKGKLAWPVQGRVAGDYGQPRGAGPVKWNGVLLEAAAGTPVRAIHRGRVAFADWLQGLGLLVIVDHGGGYMSLYGHNGALLKESGDWVEPGEPIAQVGDTGGQARPGLYFEIRSNGEPVNPNGWMAKRPAAP